MRGMESDWGGHITWSGEKEDQGVYPRKD